MDNRGVEPQSDFKTHRLSPMTDYRVVRIVVHYYFGGYGRIRTYSLYELIYSQPRLAICAAHPLLFFIIGTNSG